MFQALRRFCTTCKVTGESGTFLQVLRGYFEPESFFAEAAKKYYGLKQW